MSEHRSPHEVRPTLEGAVQRLVDRSALDLEEHPSTERWVEYQEGRLGEVEEEELQEHLAQCRICRGIVLSLAEAEKGSAEPGFEVLSAPTQWPRAENLSAFPPAVVSRSRGFRRALPSTTGWLAAALVSLAFLTTYYLHHQKIARLEQEVGRITAVAASRAPEFDLSLYEAVPEEVRVRGNEDGSPLRLGRGGTVVLELPDLTSTSDLVLSILSVANSSKIAKAIWNTAVSAKDERFGALRLPPNALPPGEYIASLTGVRDEKRRDLATYRFIIEHQAAKP